MAQLAKLIFSPTTPSEPTRRDKNCVIGEDIVNAWAPFIIIFYTFAETSRSWYISPKINNAQSRVKNVL
jgi:hypothetical protein